MLDEGLKNYLESICEANLQRLRREAEAKEKSRKENEERIKHILWTASDFSVRKNRGKTESYNIHTGEVLYTYPNCEAFTEQEAWQDIRDEFGGN